MSEDKIAKYAQQLTHFKDGRPKMVDVSDKMSTSRKAVAEAWVTLPPEARAALESGENRKGDPLVVAQLAGLAGCKRTADLITLCHPLPISGAKVELEVLPKGIRIEAMVKTTGQTGVEMEALTAVTVAALNVYDMLKATSRIIEITGVRLLHKSGGKSEDFVASQMV